MIIIEIEVPMIGKKYDFQIDEALPLREVKQELVDLICRKEQFALQGDQNRLLLWSRDGRLLDDGRSSAANGLRTGDSLLLV
ncbi:MAG: EsaB/YukD family protein [Lachnospiraceae bacterium]|nr:EsaB/YukD family protein [Lachnospiraceae bacterium]